MEKVVWVAGLCKIYGTPVAVDNVSLEVHAGEIFGLQDPNGAGKTTTMECVPGLRRSDQGRISVLGKNPQRDGLVLRKCIGMQLQQSNLPDWVRVWVALDLCASFYPQTDDRNMLLAQFGVFPARRKTRSMIGRVFLILLQD